MCAVALLSFLVACGSATAEISPDISPNYPSVTPQACSLVPTSAVAAAVAAPAPSEQQPPPSGSPAPAARTSTAAAPTGVYTVTAVGTHTPVGQCTYASPLGQTLVVNVFPGTTLARLVDITAGSTPLGPALLDVTGSNGIITVQRGSAVVSFVITLGGVSPNALATRLVAVATAATGQPLPQPSAASSAGSTPAGAPTLAPTPPPVGQPVTGQTAAQTVSETSALKFDPASVTVSAGGVVLWNNTSSVAHNVTFDSNPELTSSTMNPGDKYEVKFTQPGTYKYHCTFHPGMDGSIIVS